ncbi:MaoC/PaaZ C-terminal domain-containing protein [Gordonia sp. ABSL11-1]|uniref:MaoC/PaaZ C-terminal domain-containing protein n=1 Tax=Gordonia sp. ABSL11-1 TaxID=3053924 RepID=UPI002572AF28|nr:MaoC/PaaZ C-terminal domain-containing protein [Gordonia sp. ABSL11-1]MDL9948604.1 MaoC/PaaZ C-terminal domain-containing protein [Gordonia sp. ABSL11-1]
MTDHSRELAVGGTADPYVDKPLKITDFVRYQGASGDFNPMHHDHRRAVAAGFDQPFAVGMYAAGVMGGYATEWMGPNNIRRFRVRFAEQAWPGDVLTFTGRIVDVRESEVGREVDVELAATRQTGSVHIHGWATFAVPGGES